MKALILGINGQDGSYLADILLGNDWEVHGLHRRSSINNLERIQPILSKVTLHRGDLTDICSLVKVISEVKPDVIYNEADQDDAGWSFKTPMQSMEVTSGAVMSLLEVVRLHSPHSRFFQPLSATMFGDAPAPQDESTPFNPLSPYACAKVAAYYVCRYYRQVHKMFVSTATLYNHDSPRRGDGYLLQYLSRSAVRISRGEQENLPIGCPEMVVDIGFAKEYMQGAYQIMKLPTPDDFVLGTGHGFTIQSLAEDALREAGQSPNLIVPNPDFQRLDTHSSLVADTRKSKYLFGFRPFVTANMLVRSLVGHHKEHLPCE